MGATQFDKLWLENPSLSLKVNHTDFCYDVAINVNRPMNLKINYEYNDQLLVHDLPQNVPGKPKSRQCALEIFSGLPWFRDVCNQAWIAWFTPRNGAKYKFCISLFLQARRGLSLLCKRLVTFDWQDDVNVSCL